MTSVEILLDSVNTSGQSITTWKLTTARIILAEINTHRTLSKNTSSSRAIPAKRLIENTRKNPFIPTYWGKNEPGMKASNQLDDVAIDRVKESWIGALDNAIDSVEFLSNNNLHKQLACRLIEPWAHITMIMTATNLENFFALRAHPDAQPEFQELAYKMLEVYNNSIPVLKKDGEWHIPFGDKMPDGIEFAQKLKIATARCARTSYLTFDGEINPTKDYELHDSLLASGHMSPFEHCAYATPDVHSGNFYGWTQYRKTIAGEEKTEPRLAKRKATIKKLIDN